MIHENKTEFAKFIEEIAFASGLNSRLLEKDYHLTRILSSMHQLSDKLIFKGGTCLNKIYFSYYRLSEDLDFTMDLPQCQVSRGERRKLMQPVKDGIKAFANSLGMRLEGEKRAGRNESKQYVYNLMYPSVLQPGEQQIKLEIGLRYKPLQIPELHPVQHKFLHPFTGEPLFVTEQVRCLALKEIVSEKMRAAALRKTIAPRDFYDLDFILRQDFSFDDKQLIQLFQKKLEEDGGSTDPAQYQINLGRSETEINDMRLRVEAELLDVLTSEERKNFNIDAALKRINEAIQKAGD